MDATDNVSEQSGTNTSAPAELNYKEMFALMKAKMEQQDEYNKKQEARWTQLLGEEEEEEDEGPEEPQAGTSKWDGLFPEDTITPVSAEGKRLVQLSNEAVTGDGIKKFIKELPTYKGILQISQGAGNAQAIGVQKRMVQIMTTLTMGAEHDWSAERTASMVAAIARLTFEEMEMSRKVQAVKGNTALLDPPKNAAPSLLSEKEAAALEKASASFRAKFRLRRGAAQVTGNRGRNPKNPVRGSFFRGKSRGRGTSNVGRGAAQKKP
jgi:hypothetical protein